jgi:hypothetical protein
VTIVLPRAYPDAELFVLALLDQYRVPVLVPEAPDLEDDDIDTWLPEGFEPPFIRVQRTGGAPDAVDVTDYPIMSIGVWGTTRQAAWNLSRAVERLMLAVKHHEIEVPDVGWVLCDDAFINAGGEQLPDLDPDDRRVVQSFVLAFRRQ